MADGQAAAAGGEGQAQQVAGGAEGQGAQTPSPADLAAQAQQAAQQPAQEPEGDKGKGQEGENPWTDPEKAKREIERLRKEAGDQRMNAKRTAAEDARKALVADLMKVLDPNAGEAGATPEALLSKVQDVEGERDQAKVRAALIAEAWQAGVDPDRLEYLEFKVTRREDFQQMDLATSDIGATLRSMVTDEVAKDGSLKASGAHQGTGQGQYGGSGQQPTLTRDDFLKMPLKERADLYRNNRAEYDRLANA